MTTTTESARQADLAIEITRLAQGMQDRAKRLLEISSVLADSATLMLELGDEFAGPARAIQIRQQVEDALNARPNATDHFDRALFAALATAQRGEPA